MIETPTDFEQQCDALRMKVFSAVAHDLKTPLACIIGSLGTLDQISTRLTEVQRHDLVKIALDQAQRLDEIIVNMLEKVKPCSEA